MNQTALAQLIILLISLEKQYKEVIFEALRSDLEFDSLKIDEILNEIHETKNKDGIKCPKCGSLRAIRYGKRNGKQRYQCKECCSVFTDLSYTPLNNSRKLKD